MKIRLVKGPFGGKVMEESQAGCNVIVIRGPKRMTREQNYREFEEALQEYNAGRAPHPGMRRKPMIEARYQIAMRLQGTNTWLAPNLHNLPCMHPDGSIFYEYVEGSKKEFR